MFPDFTEAELEALESLSNKMLQVKDGVRGVAREFQTGLIVHGEGGTSKSYTVLGALRDLGASYIHHNTRMTGRGLVDALEEAPTALHLIEDAETLMDDKKAFGVLRSALWSQSTARPPVREITWQAFKTKIRFAFTGGIIIISNVNLADEVPEVRAIKTRITVLKLDVTSAEIAAKMKEIASKGYTFGDYKMSPEECWTVCKYITDRLSSLRRTPDLRLLMNGFKDYLQWRMKESVCHWNTLVDARMTEGVVYKSRSEIKSIQSEIALRIHETQKPLAERLQMWTEQTGLNQAAYYRALNRKK